MSCLNDVFIQDEMEDTMFKTLKNITKFSKTKILKQLRLNLFFLLESVNVLGYQIENNHIYPLKSKMDGF